MIKEKSQIKLLWINFIIMIIIGYILWINEKDLASIFSSLSAIISQYHIYQLRKGKGLFSKKL